MKDHVEVFFHSQQPYIHVKEEDLEKYDSGRLGFPNSYFDPEKAHTLYNQYHEQYILADETGMDGIMTNQHHAAYWNMKPSANIDAAVISRLTKKVRIAILGNIIPINDPVRMAEELAMLDCYSGGRLISGFVRGGAVETLQAGLSPTENRDRFEEAHDLIIKCWTQPGPFRFEGQYYQRRVVNPWVLPIQKPHPPIWVAAFGPKALQQAGTLGFPYLASPMEPIDRLRENYERHRLACTEAGVQIPEEVPIMRTVFVSENSRLVAGIRDRLEEEARKLSETGIRKGMSMEVDDWAIVGEPSFVRDRLAYYVSELGMTHVIVTRLRIGKIESVELERSVALTAALVV